MNKILLVFAFMSLGIFAYGRNASSYISKLLEQYNVTWSTPSETPAGSMPFGGCDIGGNVWVESGDIYFYLQKSGCFSDNGEYLKLGRIRISFSPNPFCDYNKFKQKLNLRDGYVSIEAAKSDVKVDIKLWVDIASK